MKIVRRIALLILILSIGFILKPEKLSAQNELQFSQVLTYTGISSGNFSPAYTVPANKVWKVEMMSGNSTNQQVWVNNLNVFSYSNALVAFFPIWLKIQLYI